MRRVAVAVCALLICAACSEPPHKEIDRAQGAIEAARAAGAEQYAQASFAAATTAMQETHEAVEQRDYRLALSRAIDANDRALEAATQAADGKARARSEAEVAVARASPFLRQLDDRLKAAEGARLTPTELAPARQARTEADRTLQEARAAVDRGDYAAATMSVNGLAEKITAETRSLDELITQRTARAPRRR